MSAQAHQFWRSTHQKMLNIFPHAFTPLTIFLFNFCQRTKIFIAKNEPRQTYTVHQEVQPVMSCTIDCVCINLCEICWEIIWHIIVLRSRMLILFSDPDSPQWEYHMKSSGLHTTYTTIFLPLSSLCADWKVSPENSSKHSAYNPNLQSTLWNLNSSPFSSGVGDQFIYWSLNSSTTILQLF